MTGCRLRPLEDRVVVLPAEQETVTAGGIVLPDVAQERPQRGTVVAVGPGRHLESGRLVTVGLAVGDTVVYGRFGGTEVEVDGETLLVLPAREILAVIE